MSAKKTFTIIILVLILIISLDATKTYKYSSENEDWEITVLIKEYATVFDYIKPTYHKSIERTLIIDYKNLDDSITNYNIFTYQYSTNGGGGKGEIVNPNNPHFEVSGYSEGGSFYNYDDDVQVVISLDDKSEYFILELQ
ncbi:MAG: hypothetical protein N4A76_12120 [Firmicutes bacterium]|jgi:heme/copper-type cytochrome/quinol oxidase subunit 2|nr:hypothetical protein [Bacillota bacterium]